MLWWVFGVVGFCILIRHLWKTYTHPATVLVRQAANMNWVARGAVKDSQGYRNTRLVRDGMEVEISYSPPEVRVIKPYHPSSFSDFLVLERWLASMEDEFSGAHSLNGNHEDEARLSDFYSEVEKQIALRGYLEELLAVKSSDQEYCEILFKSWLAAEQAKEDPKVIASFTLTSLEYYDKNRDIALSYLKKLESGWNAMIANPHLAAQLKQNAVEAQMLEDKTHAFKAALDAAEKKAMSFLADNKICGNHKDSEVLVGLYAWLLVYLTTYKAWKDSKTEIHQMCWNTFQRRVEIEMLSIKHDGHEDSRVITTHDGSKAFAHFSSSYKAKMDELNSNNPLATTLGMSQTTSK